REPQPAAAPDPELAAPLQPLDSFSVDTRPAGGAAPASPPAILYHLQVDGVDPQSQVMRAFRAGSALIRGKDRADDAAQLALRVREDEAALAALMRAYGYFDATVDAAVDAPAGPGAPAQVRLTVIRGAEYRLGAIAVSGAATRPPGLPREALPLKKGDVIVAPAVEAAEATVRLRLPQEGYPFLKVGQRDIVLDGASHTGDYTLPVDPGARSVFGRLEIAGKPVLPQKALDVMPRFRRGELYDSRLVDDLRRALVATGLYATVGVTDHDTGAKTAAGDEVVDLDVSGTRGKPHTLSATVGYDTGLGASAGLSWTDRDFLPPEGALTFRGLYGTQQSLLGVTLRQNNFPARDESLQWLAQVSRENIDPYDASTAQVGLTLARESTPIWQKRWTWSLGALAMVSQETGWDIDASAEVRRTYEIAALPLMLTYDHSNSLLDPTSGFRLSLTPSPEVSVGKGTQPYVRLLFDAAAYQPVLPGFSFAERIRVGSIEGADSQQIAPSRRFYSGGGGSVRGYDYESLGPQAPADQTPKTPEGNGQAIGGASLNEFSVEGRYRLSRDWGVVGFLDGGQAYLQSTPQFRDLRWGAGAGLRYFTSFGPLRLDLATPLNPRKGQTPVAVYISIGQAF
ncbi:MAG TPA: BamA/TamA family outer membrane protein, partial [Caulobacteraceae bacterium]|nr:BamA/TamA family outer membrane protein [Caulobacteraceae bacterium]